MSVSVALPNIGPTFGALYSGSIVSTVLFGFTTNQAYIYYKQYFKTDGARTQILVGILWFLDVFQVALIVHMSWTYLVAGYDSPPALSALVWSLAIELSITVLATFIVRCFYSMQLWRLSNRRMCIIGPAMMFATGQLVLGILTTVHMLVDPSIATVTTEYFQWLLGAKCIVSVLADCVITAATCYYLHASRTGFTKTNDLINLLSIYTINRGVLAMVWEAIVMVTFLTMKTNLIFAALHLMLGKLHTASLYALLNHRDTLRVRSPDEANSFTHVDLNKRHTRMHVVDSPQELGNVEVMVTSETVVEETYDYRPYTKKSRKDRYRN